MNETGSLLELLYGAFGRIETCRATMREWRDQPVSEEAMSRRASRHGARSGATHVASTRRPDSTPPIPSEQVSRLPAGIRLQNVDTLGLGRVGLWWWRVMAWRRRGGSG